ncbi:hypothetical protein F5B21DRAFT_51128 [Xylaria acuta]|nr:hypothetical protein F5B21DRAFT_51128 [Xylaria acuta]
MGRIGKGKDGLRFYVFLFSSILSTKHDVVLMNHMVPFPNSSSFVSSNLYFDDSSPICAYLYATFVASHPRVCVCMLVSLWFGMICVSRDRSRRESGSRSINNEALEYTTSIASHRFPAFVSFQLTSG